MSTATLTPTHVSAPKPLRDAVRWARETPAPTWRGEGSRKGVYVGYLAASFVGWTALGVGGGVLVNGLVEGLVSLVG